MKYCLDCKIQLPGAHANRKRCKQCIILFRRVQNRRFGRIWKKDNPEKIKSDNLKWRIENPFKVRFNHSKSIAKRRYFKFCFSIEEMIKFWKTPCHYCKESIEHDTGIGLDRIDNDKGYNRENVLPCCGECNLIRGYMLTVEEAEEAISAVLELRQRQAYNYQI